MKAVEWGSAPVLIQSTNKAGKITIIARSQWPGTYAPAADTLTIESIPYEGRQCYKEVPAKNSNISGNPRLSESSSQPTMTEEEKRRTLLEVEQQQKDFGVK